MIKYFWLLLLLTGCSTNIHLFTQGYPQHKIKQLLQQLRDRGFVVYHSDNTIPLQFQNSVIAVNPQFNQLSLIAQLQDILVQSQFPAATELRFGQGNHFYSADHIGLYLRHPDFKYPAKIPPYIVSRGCNTTLEFNNNSRFILEITRVGQEQYQLSYQEGRWQYDGKILRLNFSNGDIFIYQRNQEQRTTYQGLRPADVFKPLSGNRSNPSYHCEYEVIYLK